MGEHPIGIRQTEGLVACRLLVGGGVGIAELPGGGNADLRVWRGASDRTERKPVGEHQVFPALHEPRQGIAPARCVDAVAIAELENDLRLVERDEMGNAVTKMLCHHTRKAGKCLRRLPAQPAAPHFQCLGQLPVIERHPWRDAMPQTAVHHAVIVAKTCLVPATVAGWVDARPAHGETVRAKPEGCQQVDVLREPVIAVAGDGTIFSVCYGARFPAEYVPDALPTAVRGGESFCLVGAGSGAPDKILAKCHISSP